MQEDTTTHAEWCNFDGKAFRLFATYKYLSVAREMAKLLRNDQTVRIIKRRGDNAVYVR